MFFWNSLAFLMIYQMLAIWSLVSLPFLKPAQTSGSSQFTLLKPVLENFEHDFASMWDECNCVVVWVFFGIAFLRDWNENWHTRVLWPLLSFPNWQFVNELNEGQLHLQAGTNGWQSGLEMNYYQADPGPLPPNSERHRASGGTLGTKAHFSFFQIITSFSCIGRPSLYQWCHLGSPLYLPQVKRTAVYFHISKSLENTLFMFPSWRNI